MLENGKLCWLLGLDRYMIDIFIALSVREYWDIFVFVSFLHAANKNWVFLLQLSIIDTRQARKKLDNKRWELSNKN